MPNGVKNESIKGNMDGCKGILRNRNYHHRHLCRVYRSGGAIMKSLRKDPDSKLPWGEIHDIDDISVDQVIMAAIGSISFVAVLCCAIWGLM